VKFVRWPVEAAVRAFCRRENIPCLLVVEAGAEAPVCIGPLEDWVRAPISRQDVEARVGGLLNRISSSRMPAVDATGVLHFRSNSVVVSETQAELMEKLIDNYGEVVRRSDLEERVAKHSDNCSRNALDLHVMRLRRRISALGLSIRTVRGRGYVLESHD
jgi:DNA-binding response OmpR family regulator